MQVGVSTAERIRRKADSQLRIFLRILSDPYKMTGLEPTGFILL